MRPLVGQRVESRVVWSSIKNVACKARDLKLCFVTWDRLWKLNFFICKLEMRLTLQHYCVDSFFLFFSTWVVPWLGN